MKNILNLKQDIVDLGGEVLYSKYNGLSKLLPTLFPEYKWSTWKFDRLPLNYYISQSDKQEIIVYLKEKLNIVNKIDWNQVTLEV